MLSKGGKYFSNPAMARREDTMGGGKIDDETDEMPMKDDNEEESESPAHSHHIFKKAEGGYHSVSHHEDGSVREKDHGSHEEAMDHSRELFDQEEGSDEHEEPDGDEGHEDY